MVNGKKPIVCIVGSGPGGGVAALELTKSGRIKVILVDTDQISIPYSQSAEKHLETDKIGHPFNQDRVRGFGYGGTSNLWHGIITTLDEEDWRFVDMAAGATISSEVKPLYSQLKHVFGELPCGMYYRASSKHLCNDLYTELEKSGKFKSKDFFLQKRPFRMRDRLRNAKKSNRDIEFVENATALFLISTRNNPSKAIGLVVSVGGQRQTVMADYFVLAAGSLETPRIVLQGNEEGYFPNQNNNIGRHLFDHPWAVVGEIVSKKRWFRLGLFDLYAGSGLRYRIGHRLQKSIDSPQLGTNHSISIKPIYSEDYALFKEAAKTIVFNKPSITFIFRLVRRFKIRDIFASIFFLVCEKCGLGVFVKRALVFCYLEQPIRSESFVNLSDRYDSLGRRIPQVNWVIGKKEEVEVTLVKNTLFTALSSSDRFTFVPYENPSGSLASGAHHAGTMRIGKNSLCGVIDRDLKLFGAMNVYVCDLSIFPNYGNSNPTFTLAAFSLRLAQHILSILPEAELNN